jgi:hypothetical protein
LIGAIHRQWFCWCALPMAIGDWIFASAPPARLVLSSLSSKHKVSGEYV